MAKAKSPNAMELARGHTRLEQAVQRSRQMLRKRALVAMCSSTSRAIGASA